MSVACTSLKISQVPVAIEGKCSMSLPLGDIRVYNHAIRIQKNEMGYINVRSSPVWDSLDQSNILGKIPSGIWIPAWGPTKHHPSYGVGYIVPLKDTLGHTCRGYISITMVEEVKKDFFNQGQYFEGFPQALE